MIFNWGIIGTLVGVLLGITGSGGAIIAIPLFVNLSNVTVRDATVLSLIAVIAGAFLNWIIQRKNTDIRLATSLFTFSTLGSVLFKPLKDQAPEWIIIALFIGVALLSLVSIWKNEPKTTKQHQTRKPRLNLFKSAFGGVALGGLITMTGLGGGVIIIPFLKEVCHLPFPQATATSLLTIFLSSAFNLWIQSGIVANYLAPLPVVALVSGSLISAFLTRQLIQGIRSQTLDQMRRVLITLVIVISVGSIIYKS
jgi:uncharacterized membrane protein YfcA